MKFVKKVLVTGANGQLGKCLRDIAPGYDNCEMIFVSRDVLNIENPEATNQFFKGQSFDYCINTAAYTNVEKAESEPDTAFKVNAGAVQTMAKLCSENGIILIHISTDYVFDGDKESPYSEDDTVGPLNIYGASKLKGEQHIIQPGGSQNEIVTSIFNYVLFSLKL